MTIKSPLKWQSKTFRTFAAITAVLIMTLVTSCSSQGVTVTSKEESSATEMVDITFEGGSGKAYVSSPVEVTHEGEKSYAKLVFSSKNYDYVIVDGNRYENETPGENSTFTVPVKSLDEPFDFIADTTAMSRPHEIEYRITWNTKDAVSGSEEGLTDSVSKDMFGIRPKENERVIAGKRPDERMELIYANGFDIFGYGDNRLIRIYGVGDYLLIPEGGKAPEGLDDDITVLYQPLDTTYLVSTSVMDLVRQIGALDDIRLSGLLAKDWYIDEAGEYLEDGRMIYAGRYRAPDYELILSEGCDLAIENTMIFHDPEVKEKLEELGIPVIVETSSYEDSPLGRLEWIKLYGVLFDKEAVADDFYEEEVSKLEALKTEGLEKKSVAFFYVSATGQVCVRAPKDYVTKMIEMAGGRYVPGIKAGDATSGMGTINMQPEDLFAEAVDADIIIYNSTIEGNLSSVDDLVALNPLFSEFRAVKEGNVYCLTNGFFQKTTQMPEFITGLSAIIEGKESGNGVFYKL